MQESALTIAGRLLPLGEVEFAAFGQVAEAVDPPGGADPVGVSIPLVTRDFVAAPEAPPAILAAGSGRLFLIRTDAGTPSAEMFAAFDLRASLDPGGDAPTVVLEPCDFLSDYLGVDFRRAFRVSGNAPWSDEGLATHLAEIANEAGDPARSARPLVRFLGGSIAAHQADSDGFPPELSPRAFRAFVRRTSVGKALRTLAEETGWLASFEAAFEASKPSGEEIFLRFEAGRWILTTRTLYLVDPRFPAAAIPLGEIAGYRIHGLFRQSLEIRTAAGDRVRRPLSGDSDYLSEAEFDRVMAALTRQGFAGRRARGQAG
jgi:hypothetical protein